MIDNFPTLDDIDYEGKRILIRIDVNAPIVDSTILDTIRFESHIPTLKELEDTRLVILAHQSRPGKKDFTTLESHAAILSKLLRREVEYMDEIFGRCVVKRIGRMRKGEVLLLENVRFYSEELLKRSADEHAKSLMVKKLHPLFDLFVNDAFSASHRANASLIGFPPVMPAVVGGLVEKEIKALSRALRSEGRKIFVLGGAKIKDSIKVMKNVLIGNIAEKVVLTGVVANYFLMLCGEEIGEVNKNIVEENKEDVSDKEMLDLFRKFRKRIILPLDVGVEEGGKREDVQLGEIGGRRIMDIGVGTISMLVDEIPQYDVAVINGPAGIFEDERFTLGTFEVLKAVAKAGFSVVGGGHVSTAARMIEIDKKITHISPGGGACIRFLSGEKLIALEVIRECWEKKWSSILRLEK